MEAEWADNRKMAVEKLGLNGYLRLLGFLTSFGMTA